MSHNTTRWLHAKKNIQTTWLSLQFHVFISHETIIYYDKIAKYIRVTNTFILSIYKNK